MSHLLPTITPGIAPWWYYLCVGAAVLIVGISKAGFGGGVGILAIPVMAQVMPPKRRFVGPMLMYFLLINTAKLPTFISLDLINKRTLSDSIWFVPLLLIGTLLGTWMNRKVLERPFAVIMYMMAAVAAAAMVYKALWGG